MISRVITSTFDGSQASAIPLFRGGISPQHFTVFNSKPASGFSPITPNLVGHYDDSADLLVPPGWQGSVDVTLYDGIGGPWPASQIAYGQATFTNSQQATVTMSKAFADAFWRAQVGAITITDGGGPVIVTPDYSTRTKNTIVLNATTNFSGTVDLVAMAGNGKLSAMGGQRATASFSGNEDFVDVTWPSSLASYFVTVGAADLGTGGAFFNITNFTPSGCRVQPLARFNGNAEITVISIPVSPLLQATFGAFNGTQDSVAVSWSDPGVPFSILWGVGLLDSPLGDVIPHLTSRTATGATINISQRFSGVVNLVIVPNR